MDTQIKVEWTREQFSALMDGRLPGGELSEVMGAMNAPDGEARDCWHLYHLIGDVLRSSDLAAYGRDPGLAQRVSASIASQPIAQPAPSSEPLQAGAHSYAERPAANDGLFRWKMVAGLASFAAVAAVGWGVLSGAGPQPVGSQLAQGPGSTPGQVLAVAAPAQTVSSAGDVDASAPVMLRDARLDELLAAHRQAAGGSSIGGASGFLRNATFEGHAR